MLQLVARQQEQLNLKNNGKRKDDGLKGEAENNRHALMLDWFVSFAL